MKLLFLLVLLALPVSGCVGLDSLRGMTDATIDRAERVSDGILARLDQAQVELATEIERVRAARCRLPLTALVRWARLNMQNRVVLATDCGLLVNDAPTTVLPGRMPLHEKAEEKES